MTLVPFERRWAAAAMEAIFPGSLEAGLADIRGMDVDGFVRGLLSDLPFRAALGVRMAVWLVALAPIFVLKRFGTLVALSIVERERVIGALVASRIYVVRSLVLVLKTMGALLYAADSRVRTRMMPPRSDVMGLRVKRLQTVRAFPV
jgi:hypothetical protein